MKVCVITTYWKGSGGGVSSYLSNLVYEMGKRVEVQVIFREGHDNKNIQLKCNRFIFPIIAFMRLLSLKPDVLHSNGAWYCLLPAVIYGKLNRIKVVHTFHTYPTERIPVFFKLFLQILIDNCDCVTFVSQALQSRIQDFWGLRFKKSEITYGGAEKRFVSEKEKIDFIKRYHLQGKGPILLLQAFTANKLKAEGAKILMLTLKKLKVLFPNIMLLITRNGPYLEELRRFAYDIDIKDNVLFTGDIENPFVALDLCDIYTHISLAEGFGMALLEAMAMGKPIVATSIGGIPEAIKNMENGVLVEPNVGSISNAIILLL
ncbi:MAG: glycosyltransferase family 4 protein [Candidatus Methanosuratincola sp.]